MGPIAALAFKDLRLLLRDRGALFFALGFPLLMAVFFGTIFGGGGATEGPRGVPVAIVDLDRTADSARFIDDLAAGDEFDVSRYETSEAAVEDVRQGRRSAAIILAEGFAASRESVFWGEPARIDLIYDPSRGAEAAMIEGILTREAFRGLSDTFGDPNAMLQSTSAALQSVQEDEDLGPLAKGSLTELLRSVSSFYAVSQESWMTEGDEGESAVGQAAWQPVRIESASVRDVGSELSAPRDDRPSSGYDVSFPQGIIWGLLGVSAGFGISLVSERTGGTLRRLRVAPISRSDVLLGKGLACFLAAIAVSALLILIGVLLFGVQPENWPLLALGVASAGVCFTGIMMLLSVLGRSEQAAAGIGWAVLLVLGMLGGAMVPLFIMPAWMQSMASFSPVKWAILAVEGPLWRGFGIDQMLIPCGILLTTGAAAFAIGASVFGRLEEA